MDVFETPPPPRHATRDGGRQSTVNLTTPTALITAIYRPTRDRPRSPLFHTRPRYAKPVPTMPSDSADDAPAPTQRRHFIGQLVSGAAAIAAGACTRTVPAQAVAPAQAPAGSSPSHAAATDSASHTAPAAAATTAHHSWDLSWTTRVASATTHKQVFDTPEIAEGTALHQARMFYVNYKEVYNSADADLAAVIVVRHVAIPMVLGDAVWAHYPFLGKKATKLKDPTTNEWALRNPFLNAKKDDKYALIWPDGGLDTLIGRGTIVLACNLALTGFAGRIAKKTQQADDVVLKELTDGLVPGVTLVPSGIFGVIRAEQAGCAYIRAT
jgi:intracellular sulfur oxidation DsrE/DsrF family protein